MPLESPQTEVVARAPDSSEERLQVLMHSILSQEDGFELSEKQVDEVLYQRRVINGFVHDERMQKHERFKIGSKDRKIYFFGTLIFSAVVMLIKPEYFTEVLFALLGFLGGYGMGKKEASDKPNG